MDSETSGVRRVAIVISLAAIGAGCSARTADIPPPLAAAPSAISNPSEPTPQEAAPAVTSAAKNRHAVFRGTIARIPADLAARMRGTTWRPGCPVPIPALRLLTLSYRGFDGEVHRGPMVVNAGVARDVMSVFHRLFRARFPINAIALSHRYLPKHDNPNSRSSVTASFNCRVVVTPSGPGTTLSMHSFGLAIDINPLQNPFVAADGHTRNRFARPYVDRSKDLPGMIHDGDVVVRAFESIGWKWGGRWSGGKDYMHFSVNGN